jgi:hypothetical protein
MAYSLVKLSTQIQAIPGYVPVKKRVKFFVNGWEETPTDAVCSYDYTSFSPVKSNSLTLYCPSAEETIAAFADGPRVFTYSMFGHTGIFVYDGTALQLITVDQLLAVPGVVPVEAKDEAISPHEEMRATIENAIQMRIGFTGAPVTFARPGMLPLPCVMREMLAADTMIPIVAYVMITAACPTVADAVDRINAMTQDERDILAAQFVVEEPPQEPPSDLLDAFNMKTVSKYGAAAPGSAAEAVTLPQEYTPPIIRAFQRTLLLRSGSMYTSHEQSALVRMLRIRDAVSPLPPASTAAILTILCTPPKKYTYGILLRQGDAYYVLRTTPRYCICSAEAPGDRDVPIGRLRNAISILTSRGDILDEEHMDLQVFFMGRPIIGREDMRHDTYVQMTASGTGWTPDGKMFVLPTYMLELDDEAIPA